MQKAGEDKLLQELTFKPTINKRSAVISPKKMSFNQTTTNYNSQGILEQFEDTRIQSVGKTRICSPQQQRTNFSNLSVSKLSFEIYPGRSPSPGKSQKIYNDKIILECDEVVKSIGSEKRRVGLIFDDFVNLMTKFGFARIDDIDLLSKVFQVKTGFEQKNKKFTKNVAILSIASFKALYYCLRNCFDCSVLNMQKAFPDACSDVLGSDRTVWYLDQRTDFMKFHKMMLQLNMQKTQFEFDLKKESKMAA